MGNNLGVEIRRNRLDKIYVTTIDYYSRLLIT